jgi:hypothetical protein
MSASTVSAPTTQAPGATTQTRWLLALPRTTPARLRAGLVVLVLGSLALGLIAVRTSVRRLDAARTFGEAAAPQLVDAQDVYVRLVDADAAVSNAFLNNGNEPPALAARYRNDIEAATAALPALARRIGTASARNAVRVISESLPVYTGLVEAARANNRQAFPVGAAYLHDASSLMRETLLPAATTVYEDAGAQLAQSDHRGGGSADRPLIVGFGIVLVLLLIAMLVYVAARTRRIFNLGLVFATVAITTLVVASSVALTREQHALEQSRTTGADPLQVVAAARILTLRSFSDENLDLIERGAASYLPDFTTAISAIDGAQGLESTGLLRAPFAEHFKSYLDAHAQLMKANSLGRYQGAIELATKDEARLIDALDTEFKTQLTGARQNLDRNARDARHALESIALLSALLSALAIAFIILGLRLRLREYA